MSDEYRQYWDVVIYRAEPLAGRSGEVLELTRLEMARIDAGRRRAMHWIGPDGAGRVYRGVLSDLGFAIPRQMPEHGPRRFLSDLALGYASGFPGWHVLVYSFRSAFMPRAEARRVARVSEEVRSESRPEPIDWSPR